MLNVDQSNYLFVIFKFLFFFFFLLGKIGHTTVITLLELFFFVLRFNFILNNTIMLENLKKNRIKLHFLKLI